tara:strand:- start:270 stop:635 length:366 start_codon:yes stop_codon:yes gene_type:complete
MNNILNLIGRILISSVFLISGINKINQYHGTIEWMESFGVPGILIMPAILLEIIGSLMIIVGYKTQIIAMLFSIFCISLAIIFHNDFSNQMELISFLKNLALAGGFLFLAVNGPGKISLDK